MVLRSVRLSQWVAVLCLAGTITAAQVTPLSRRGHLQYAKAGPIQRSQASNDDMGARWRPWLSDTHHLWHSDAAQGIGTKRAGHGCAWTPCRAQHAALHLRAARASARRRRRYLNRRAQCRAREASNFSAARGCAPYHSGGRSLAYNISTGRAVTTTTSPGAEDRGDVQPDGRSVAFVRNNNLFVARPGLSGENGRRDVGWKHGITERHPRRVYSKAVRPRQPPRVLVESRLITCGVFAIRRARGSAVPAA